MPTPVLVTPFNFNRAIRRRLPAEVLGYIMELTTYSSGEFPTMDPTAAPLAFTQVCSYWRKVSKSTPYLWSSHAIPNFSQPPADMDAFLRAVVAWILRSGGLGLKLKVETDLDDEDDDSGSVRALMTTLMSHSQRWKDVYLVSSPEKWNPGWSHSLATACGKPLPLPRLETLTLGLPSPGTELLSMLSNAPRLHSLKAHYHRQHFPLLNLSSLTHLHLISLCNVEADTTLLPALQRCTSLTSLIISYNRLWDANDPLGRQSYTGPGHTLHLPSLLHLELNLLHCTPILHAFFIPNLLTLKLRSENNEHPNLRVGSLIFPNVETFECKLECASILDAFVFPDLRHLKYAQSYGSRAWPAAPRLITLLRNSANSTKGVSGAGARMFSLDVSCVLEGMTVVEILGLCPQLRVAKLSSSGASYIFWALTMGDPFSALNLLPTVALPPTSATATVTPDPVQQPHSLCPHLRSLSLRRLGETAKRWVPRQAPTPGLPGIDSRGKWADVDAQEQLAKEMELFESFVGMVGSRGWGDDGGDGGDGEEGEGRSGERGEREIGEDEAAGAGSVVRLMEVKMEVMDTTMKIFKDVHVEVMHRLKGYVESGFECGLGTSFGANSSAV
ncbi:uncharacterized protein STEHIDRAFT_161978 [Stereum hirsutum FP-91666 SS1]|uniref:uncharacterized protein n=1 Tax=Stereum hirsutum (strain FP-91666) TaxID=721885 RepID=UPI000444A1A6|nr:uncharacterized protein STEHIDRAFT_161978 [Stereum hirsutum FP-91666 SS1]EIM80971.1 hypothetical protein STEHIDRAFT_161978 [Stereum hirsutum FP-91666 SS1]